VLPHNPTYRIDNALLNNKNLHFLVHFCLSDVTYKQNILTSIPTLSVHIASKFSLVLSTLNVIFSVCYEDVQKCEELTDRIEYENITRKGLLCQFLIYCK